MRLITMTTTAVMLAACAVPMTGSAQGGARPAAPVARDSVKADFLGGATVTISHDRVSKRSRKIFGALVPYGNVWNLGAAAPPTLVTDRSVMIGDSLIRAGTYTLYAIPTETSWTLIVSRGTGTTYDPSQDVKRIPMTVKKVAMSDWFTVSIRDGELRLGWDTVQASTSIAGATRYTPNEVELPDMPPPTPSPMQIME